MRFWIRVSPNSKRPGVGGTWEGPDGPVLRVAVSAPAVDGKANKAVISELARALGIKRSQLSIAHGQKSRTKLIETADSDEVSGRIAELMDGA